MTGGKSRPKKDKSMKVCAGKQVKRGQILSRGLSIYKAGINVKGLDTLYALCSGKIYFSRKKTSRGRPRTFIHILPDKQ